MNTNSEHTSKFNKGDVVSLKSGGPQMTIQVFSEESGQVNCHWFDNANKLQEGVFDINTIEAINADSSNEHSSMSLMFS